MKVKFQSDENVEDQDDVDLDLDDADLDDEATVEISDGEETRVEFTDDEDEDEEPVQQAEEEEVDDDDLSSYSKPVRERLRKERAEAQEARQRADAAERELVKVRAQSELATIDKDLDAAIDEVEEARRDADTRKEILAQAKVSRLSERKETLEKTRDSDGEAPKTNAAVDRWVARNKNWWTDPKYEAQRGAALAIGRRLAAEGKSDDTDEFYAALDKELSRTVRLPKDRDPPPRTTFAGRMTNRTQQDATGRKARLDAKDVKFMRSLRLDPTNKAHVNQYLMEKRNAR